jgi:hypothetical protein
MLDLHPEVESEVLARARLEGTSVSDYIAELLKRDAPHEPDQSAGSNDPVIEFLRAQLMDAERATPGEIDQAETEWQELKRSLNEARRASGEALLFLEQART